MRIGVVTDVHLSPPGTAGLAWHNPYALDDAAERFGLALRHAVAAGAEAIAMLGDLDPFGGEASLAEGVEIAATAGVPAWMVPGNHDCTRRDDALGAAVARHGGDGVEMAPAAGFAVANGIRLAGLGLIGDPTGMTARSAGALPVAAWGDEPVLLLSHYPLVSFVAEAEAAGLAHAGDLLDLAEAAAPVLARRAPTVLLHGHTHLRHAAVEGALLQIACAALIEPPFELTLIDVARVPTGLDVRRRALAVAPTAAIRLPVLSPDDQAWSFRRGSWSPR